MDVPVEDVAFQENVDIGKGSTIDALIEDVGPLVHDSRSSKEHDSSRTEETIRLQPSSRAATYIKAVFQEWFNGPYHTWNRTQGQRGWGAEKHKGGSISFTETIVKWQKDLIERFSWSKYLKELHKHQKERRRGKKFHEVRRKAEEDAEASGTPMPDDLQLMAIIAGGVNRGHLYRAGSKAVHFIDESSRAAAGLVSCCLDHKQRLIGGLRMLYREYLPPSTSTYGGYSSIMIWHTFHSR
ncbi:hypothetical protein M9H77_23273 [Catharanthus roseus]|uniref:Uncharacterized protein n=1 Tax=Catharanthus roseus TaxID=4058 RepID=A0ACC0AUK0_CATRO|nr:hypothetical protein M9H77_23273 [Catharanthus roseus]